jgi:effector-binding domain-containing protein
VRQDPRGISTCKGRVAMAEFEVIEVPEKPYLYKEAECSMDPAEISKAMGVTFQAVYDFIQAQGITSAKEALSVYYSYDPNKMRFRAGFTVSPEDAAKAAGEVKADVTPAGRVVHFTHVGPYATLRDAYGEMMGWMQAEGHEMRPPTWEVYVNDPTQVPEAELITEVYTRIA